MVPMSPERIVVALTGGPEGSMLLRRGARIAGRVAGRSLIAVHVVRSDGTATSATEIERQRLLVENLGGSLQLIVGDDIAATVLEFARSVNGTQIIVGASRHGRLAQLFRPSVANAIVMGSGDIDVYMVTHPRAARSPRPRTRNGGVPGSLWSWAAAVLLPIVLAALLWPWRDGSHLDKPESEIPPIIQRNRVLIKSGRKPQRVLKSDPEELLFENFAFELPSPHNPTRNERHSKVVNDLRVKQEKKRPDDRTVEGHQDNCGPPLKCTM